MPQYTEAEEPAQLGTSVIEQHYPLLKPLKLKYLFRPEAVVSNGVTRAGMCIRVDDRNYAIHRVDFIIELAADIWKEATPQFRHALIDHELGHCGVTLDPKTQLPAKDEKTGRTKTFCRHHDIEEFEQVLERHGAYHKGLRQFLEAYAKNKASKTKLKVQEVDDSIPQE